MTSKQTTFGALGVLVLLLLPPTFASAVDASPATTLRPAGAELGDEVGASVSVSGNLAIIGAPGGDYAVLFERDDTGEWVETTRLDPSDWDAAGPQRFGAAVAVDAETGWVVVGAPDADDGVGRAYALRHGMRDVKQVLAGPDSPALRAFGASLALDGATLLVGAPESAAGSGSVLAFGNFEVRHKGSRTTHATWELREHLPAPHAAARAFGASIALDASDKGNRMIAVIGAPSSGEDEGAAFAFVQRGNGAWSRPATLSAPEGAAGDRFGAHVALDQRRAAVGAPGDGSVTIWEVASKPRLLREVRAEGPLSGTIVEGAVAADDNLFVVPARLPDGGLRLAILDRDGRGMDVVDVSPAGGDGPLVAALDTGTLLVGRPDTPDTLTGVVGAAIRKYVDKSSPW